MKISGVLSFRTLFIIDISVDYFIGTYITAQKMPTGCQKFFRLPVLRKTDHIA
jgi:hypothetical protein